MPRILGELVIERPREVVFDFVADECNEPKYNPRMVRAEQTSSGPIGKGTCYTATMKSRAGPVDMTIEVTEFDRPRTLARRRRSEGWTSTASSPSMRFRAARVCGGTGS